MHLTDVQDPLGEHINSSTVDVGHSLIKLIKKEIYFPEDFELGELNSIRFDRAE